MEERFIYRTHYQVTEPRLFTVLIRSCASPTAAAHPDTVAECLSRSVGVHGKRLNVPAARYAVDIARRMELVAENQHWSWKAHAINLVSTPEATVDAPLTLEEQLLFLKYYLERDGAILLEILHRASSGSGIPKRALTETDFIDDIFRHVWTEYLEVAVNVRQRTELRHRLEDLKRRPLEPKTRKHKTAFHFEALVRLGLLELLEDDEPTFVLAQGRGSMPAAELARELSSLQDLDKAAESGSLWQAIGAAYAGYPGTSPGVLKEFWPAFSDAYARISATDVAIVPIGALIDYAVTKCFVAGETAVTTVDLMAELERQRSKHPSSMRFHVDRQGRPAFIVMDDSLLDDLGQLELAPPA